MLILISIPKVYLTINNDYGILSIKRLYLNYNYIRNIKTI